MFARSGTVRRLGTRTQFSTSILATLTADSRDGGGIGVQLGDGQVEAVIGRFGAGRMSCEDGGVRKGAHDVGGAAVGGHGDGHLR